MRLRLVALLACAVLVSGCIPLFTWLAGRGALEALPGPTGTPGPTLRQTVFTPSTLITGATCGPGVEVDLPSDFAEFLVTAGASEPECLDLGHGAAPIAVFTVPGQEAVNFWELLALTFEESDWWPVLVGDGPALDLLIDAATVSEVEVDAIYDLAADIDYATWMAERTTTITGGLPLPEDQETFEPVERAPYYSAHRDVLTGDFLPRVYLLAVPAKESPDVVAQVLFGCWNDNPCPAEHLAVLRHWHEVYDADIVSIGEIMELRIGKPPTDWEESLQLAREQYVYDYDIVDQGVGTINRLAQELRGSGSWYFWWD